MTAARLTGDDILHMPEIAVEIPASALYAYTGNDPLNRTDPSGLCASAQCGNANPSNSLIQVQTGASATAGLVAATNPTTPTGQVQLAGLQSAGTTAQSGQSDANGNIQLAANEGTPGNDQVQNAQVRSVVSILGLTRDQQQQLHREISGQITIIKRYCKLPKTCLESSLS